MLLVPRGCGPQSRDSQWGWVGALSRYRSISRFTYIGTSVVILDDLPFVVSKLAEEALLYQHMFTLQIRHSF